ncbi:hypothetical protein T265_02219 [Opisthorchis viverrini]|uniref:Uncharacterized protein n=1 Tax=Opisthorchis viverrini TaxID=6198 RepID=A0A074ZWT8_OPIVI|nr:hypothetical protein T265_02219 [Opisthorchis viverrini]KER31581.1 hypothetical protein T265_02219 [Opisthorchis viverrini]
MFSTYCGNRENLKLARPKLRCDTDVARPVKILVQALGGRNHLYNIRQLTSVLRDDTNVEHRQDALSAEDYQKLKVTMKYCRECIGFSQFVMLKELLESPLSRSMTQ